MKIHVLSKIGNLIQRDINREASENAKKDTERKKYADEHLIWYDSYGPLQSAIDRKNITNDSQDGR